MNRTTCTTLTLALVSLVLAPGAHAFCANFVCKDSVRGLMIDSANGSAFVNLRSNDETQLQCIPTNGPAPFMNSLELKRSSMIFTEAYQILLLSTASTLPLQVEVRNQAGTACEITRVTLDPFGNYP